MINNTQQRLIFLMQFIIATMAFILINSTGDIREYYLGGSTADAILVGYNSTLLIIMLLSSIAGFKIPNILIRMLGFTKEERNQYKNSDLEIQNKLYNTAESRIQNQTDKFLSILFVVLSVYCIITVLLVEILA